MAPRQTHTTESPFNQAASVPKDTYKTVLDAWEGYHSIPLAKKDQHYTTFITPLGRYRYKTAPQGFLAARDGYTARYDKVAERIKRRKQCVDDSLLHDTSIEEQFFRTCQFLSLCISNGIIFNLKKFHFAEKEVEYLGFEITEDSVRPSK